MKPLSQIAFIAILHVAFLFAAYGTKFFGLNLPSGYGVYFWLGAPAILTFAAFFFTLIKSKWLPSAIYREGLWVVFSGFAVLISTYIGVFLAFNTYGV